MAKGQGPRRHRVREGDSLLQVRSRRAVFAEEEQNSPQGIMRLDEVRRVSLALCQPIELFPQLPRGWQCPRPR